MLRYLQSWIKNMRGVKKENLPVKICFNCGRPFMAKKVEKIGKKLNFVVKNAESKKNSIGLV